MRHDSPEAIGARLAHIRAHTSQREHSEALGVPLRTYQNYERGEREPDLRTYVALIARGWNANWLLTGEGPERLDATQAGGAAAIDREAWARAKRIVVCAGEFTEPKPGPGLFADAIAHTYDRIAGRPPDNTELPDLIRAAQKFLQSGIGREK